MNDLDHERLNRIEALAARAIPNHCRYLEMVRVLLRVEIPWLVGEVRRLEREAAGMVQMEPIRDRPEFFIEEEG